MNLLVRNKVFSCLKRKRRSPRLLYTAFVVIKITLFAHTIVKSSSFKATELPLTSIVDRWFPAAVCPINSVFTVLDILFGIISTVYGTYSKFEFRFRLVGDNCSTTNLPKLPVLSMRAVFFLIPESF